MSICFLSPLWWRFSAHRSLRQVHSTVEPLRRGADPSCCFISAAEGRQKRGVPNWAMTSSDFFGWVEELRKHAGYDQINDLARTFWAHFPSADRLGYGTHEADE
uniref:Si:ch73-23l24.1 n=1 Tax=Stegastes partitus TaxID=144197 RepID=A0A3B4ZD12_9TELE